MITPVPKQKYQAVQDWLIQSLDFETKLINQFEHFISIGSDEVAYSELTKGLFELLELNYTNTKSAPIIERLDDFNELRKLLTVFHERQTEPQALERFYSQEGDPVWLRLAKLAKRAALRTGWSVVRMGNVFRRNKRKPEFWKHEIAESALASYVFIDRFTEHLAVFMEGLLGQRHARVRQLHDLDRTLEQVVLLKGGGLDLKAQLAALQQSLEEDKQAIRAFFEEIEPGMDKLFADLYDKAGTIGFPLRKLKSRATVRAKRLTLKQLDAGLQYSQWVLFGLTEHWRLKLNNRSLIFKLKSQTGEQQGAIQQQIDENLKPAFIQMKRDLADFASMDPQNWNDSANVLAIRQYVQSHIPQLIQLIFQTKLSALFERPMLELEQAIKRGPEIHRFAANVFEGKTLSANSFQLLKTRDLLSGIVLKSLKEQFVAERKKFDLQVQRLLLSLDEIQLAANYSVDFFLGQNEEEKVTAELNEGMKRTVKKADGMLANMAEIQKLTADSFSSLSDSFTRQVLQYFEPRHLHQTVKINQRRTRNEQMKENLRELIAVSKKYSLRYLNSLKKFWQKLNNRYFNLRSLLGISYEKTPISAELSNYLSETKQAISRLPLMYQKLFENTPLSDERFYLPRRTDLSRLDEAFANWRNSNFAPTCVVGEEGCGTTTLFNFFVKSLVPGYRITRFELRDNIAEEQEMLSFFRQGFPKLRFAEFDELIDALNEQVDPQVVILENIHNLFLRTNGAYGNLYRLFRLVSQTNKKVFWLTSCFEYSWKLLNYTTGIAGYFGHVVEFSPLSAGELKDAILKRHQVSGFSIQFLEPEGFSPKRSYQKLDEEAKQVYLSDIFFEEHWQYARSNIRLAFIFWLRAIRKVENGVIYLQQKHLSFDFLNSLKANEITTLHSILVHGGLSRFEHARVFRWDEADSARVLMVLSDDGLLEKENDTYVVNPLVYRMLVSQLKSLNFIY